MSAPSFPKALFFFVSETILMQISREDFIEMGRSLGELQRELGTLRDREEGREKRTEHSLEELEALIFAKDQDTDRRFQEQAKENAETIDKVLIARPNSQTCHCTAFITRLRDEDQLVSKMHTGFVLAGLRRERCFAQSEFI